MADQKKYIVIELKTTGQTKEIEKNIQRVTKDLRGYEDALKKIKKSYDDLKLAQKEAKDTGMGWVNGMSKTLPQINTLLRKNHKEYLATTANLQSNKKAFNEYTSDVKKGSKDISKGFKDQAASVGELAMTVGSLILAWNTLKEVMGFLIKSHMEFEYTLMQVQTNLDTIDRTLKRGSIKIMKDWGFSIADVNKSLYDVISAMIPANQAIGFLNEAAKLAVGGVTTLKIAVDGLTSIINAYSLSATEAGRVSDAFFRAQRFAKATTAELIDEIGRIAPVASIAGVSYQEMLGALSELTLGGLDARESVTVLRQAIAGLIKPAAGAEAALRKYNVPVGTAEVANAGLSYSLEKLMEAYEEFPDIIAEMIPNIRAFTGVTALTAARLEHMDFIINDINHNWGEMSSLSVVTARMMSTSEMKYRKFRGELNALGVTIGEKLKKPLNWLMDNFKLISTLVSGAGTAFITFIGTLGAVNSMIRIVTASAALLGSTFAMVTGGISIALGLLATWLVASKNKSNDLTDSISNLRSQITSTKEAFAFFIDELKKTNDELKRTNLTTEEHDDLIKKKGELIDELNTNYVQYLDNLISEKNTNEELGAIIDGVNKKIELSIVLRNRLNETQKYMNDLQPALAEPLGNIDEIIQKRFKDQSKEFSQYSRALDMLVEQYIQDSKRLQAEYASEDKMEAKRTETVAKMRGLTTKTFGENSDVIIELNEDFQNLIRVSDAYAAKLQKLDEITQQWNDDIEKSKQLQKETLREFTPNEMMTLPVIGWTGIESSKITYDDFVKSIGALPPEYDEYRKRVMDEYIVLFNELKNTIATGSSKLGVKYMDMDAEGRSMDDDLTALEQKLIAKYKEIQKTLTDEQIKLLESFDFYGKKVMDKFVPLTEEQIKELGFMIKDWNQKLTKEVNDHNRFMINMQLSYLEDSTNNTQQGYTKELSLINIAYAKKLATLEANYEREKAARIAFIEDQQINSTKYGKMIGDMLLLFDKEYNKKLLQEHSIYLNEKRLLLNRQIDDIKDFRSKYVDEGDKLLQLEKQLGDTLMSMTQQLGSLAINEEFVNTYLTTVDLSSAAVESLVADLIKLETSITPTSDSFSSIVKAILEFADGITLASEAYIKFYKDVQFQRAKIKAEVLDSMGVLTLEERQKLELLELEKVIYDNREGLIKQYTLEAIAKNNGVALTKEETAAVAAQVDQLEELSRALAKMQQQSDKIEARRPSGNVTYGEIHQSRSNQIKSQAITENWTTQDLEVAMKNLEKEIPNWMRNLTETAYSQLIAYGNKVLDIASSTISSIFQLQADAANREYQHEMDLIQDKHNTELDLLKNRLDKGLLSEEQYAKQKERIDAKYQRREEEMKRRKFEKDKQLAITQIIIQGAIGAIRAYADTGLLGGIVGSALVAAETAAQVMLVSAQKYAKGGLRGDKLGLVGGNKHSAGGTKFYGEDGSVFEAERGELMAIINAQDTATLGALSSINSMHGKAFGKGGLYGDGGYFMRGVQNSIKTSFETDKLIKAIYNMPNPVVYVDDIQKQTKKSTIVKDAAKH